MSSVCEGCHHARCRQVTSHLCLPGTFLVLALQALSPEKPLSHRQPPETINSVVLDNQYVCAALCSQGAYSFQGHKKATHVIHQLK